MPAYSRHQWCMENLPVLSHLSSLQFPRHRILSVHSILWPHFHALTQAAVINCDLAQLFGKSLVEKDLIAKHDELDSPEIFLRCAKLAESENFIYETTLQSMPKSGILHFHFDDEKYLCRKNKAKSQRLWKLCRMKVLFICLLMKCSIFSNDCINLKTLQSSMPKAGLLSLPS